MSHEQGSHDDRRSGDDRREDSGPSLRVNWAVVVQVITYAIGVFVLYNTLTLRITALETNRVNDVMRLERNEQRLERIELKLDRALERK